MGLFISSSPTSTHASPSSCRHQEHEHLSYCGDCDTDLHGYHVPLRFYSIHASSLFGFYNYNFHHPSPPAFLDDHMGDAHILSTLVLV